MDYLTKYLKYKNKYINLKNQLGSGDDDICDLNSNFKTHIYHFEKENPKLTIPVNNEINYNFRSFDETTLENFEAILDTCKNENILIYINSDNDCEFINKINTYLTDILKKSSIHRFLNVTIINKTTNLKCMIYELENKENLDIYKKIINMIPENIIETHPYYHNKKKTVTKNLYEPFEPIINEVGLTKEITYMINTNINNESNLEDTWWYKYYFNIPFCARGRLSQSTGTCWCNALINVILLTPGIYELILEKFKNLSEEQQNKIKQIKSFDEFIGSDYDLVTLIYATINILIINKSKAKQKNGNFITEIGARIKGSYDNNNENFYKENITNDKEQKKNAAEKYADAGWPHNGLLTIFQKIFKEDEDYIKIDYIFNLNIDNIKYKKIVILHNEETKIYNEYINETDEERKLIIYKKLSSIRISRINLEIQYLVTTNTLNDENIKIKQIEIDKLITEINNIINYRIELIKLNNNNISENLINNYNKIIKLKDVHCECINIVKNNILEDAIKYYKNNISKEFSTKIPNNLLISNFLYEYKNNILINNVEENTILFKINNINPPKIVFIEYKLLSYKNDEEYILASNAPDIILINNIRYSIHASTLLLTPNANHAIAGLKCNNSLYVYDSNNFLAHTNWNKYTKNDETNDQYRKLLNPEYKDTIQNNSVSLDNIKYKVHYSDYPESSKENPPYTLLAVIYIKEDA